MRLGGIIRLSFWSHCTPVTRGVRYITIRQYSEVDVILSLWTLSDRSCQLSLMACSNSWSNTNDRSDRMQVIIDLALAGCRKVKVTRSRQLCEGKSTCQSIMNSSLLGLHSQRTPHNVLYKRLGLRALSPPFIITQFNQVSSPRWLTAIWPVPA